VGSSIMAGSPVPTRQRLGLRLSDRTWMGMGQRNDRCSAIGRPFGLAKSRTSTSVWAWRVVATILLTLVFQWRVGRILPVSGDEPHYVLTSISLLRDGDANLANNYRADQGTDFGFPGLRPQGWDIREAVIPAPHGTKFPLLISGPYVAFGVTGVRIVLVLISLLGILLTAGVCDRLGLPPRAGTWSAFLIAASPVWQSHASRVLPEVTAGSLFMGVIWLALGLPREYSNAWRAHLFLLGAGAMCLPVLYAKYAPLGMAALGLVLTVAGMRRAVFALSGAAVVFAASRVFLVVVSGNLWDTAGGRLSDAMWAGCFERFWRLWFDRGHGLLVYEPWTLLAFWAAPAALANRNRCLPLMWLTGGFIAYSLMYSLFPYVPGESMPGRYMVAILPAISVLICTWTLRFRNVLGAIALAGLSAVTISHSAGAMITARPHWDLFPGYADLYASYWPPASFNTAAPIVVRPAANLGLFVIAAVIITKLIALGEDDEPGSSDLVQDDGSVVAYSRKPADPAFFQTTSCRTRCKVDTQQVAPGAALRVPEHWVHGCVLGPFGQYRQRRHPILGGGA